MFAQVVLQEEISPEMMEEESKTAKSKGKLYWIVKLRKTPGKTIPSSHTSTFTSLFQAPTEMREGECEGTKTRGEWGTEKEGKKRSL